MKIFSLLPDEKLILTRRFSLFLLFQKIFTNIFLFGAIGALIGFFAQILVFKNDEIFFTIFLAIFFAAISICYQFFLWRKPILFLTNKRLIFSHQKSFFAGKNAEIKLQNISEIVAVKKSFLNSFFGFATIVISPLSGTEKFKIPFVPRGGKIANLITATSEKSENINLNFKDFLKNDREVIDFFEISPIEKIEIKNNESFENRGISQVLSATRVFCVLRNGKINLPKNAIAQMPSLRNEENLKSRFKNLQPSNSILMVGLF